MSVQIIKNITTDVVKRGVTRPVYAKQNDVNSRFLNIRIQEDGVDIIVEPTSTVILNVERSDHAEDVFYGSVNPDGTVKVLLNSWILALAGTNVCDVSIISANPEDMKLTTMSFNIYVEEASASDDSVTEIEEYSVIVDLLRRTAEAEARAQAYEVTTKEHAERAEAAALRAEAALGKVEITVDATLEIEGMAADAKAAGDRLKVLEKWMRGMTYEPMKVTLTISKPSVEYGDTVSGAVLTWTVDQDVSYIRLTLPDNKGTVDVTGKSSYTDPNTYSNVTSSKKWTIVAKRSDGEGEEVTEEVTMSVTYTQIKFNSLTMNPSATRYEHGASIENVKLKWSLSKQAKLIKVSETTLAGVKETTFENDDASITEYTATGPFTSNVSWSVEAKEAIGKDGIATSKKSIEFYYFVYYGLGTLATGFDSDFVTKLSSGPKETTTQAIGFNLTPNYEYIYYAIPVALANDPTFIIDKGFAGGFEYFEDISVTKTILGQIVSVLYRVYRSDQRIVGSTRVDVS